jgi:IclR family acetate operon transcriptional repressor
MTGAASSLDKTLSVLEALVEHDRLADIAARAGLPKSTVHRILRGLVERGFARSDGTGTYLPGPRILSLAGQALARYDFSRHAGPVLHSLQARTGHTVHFAIHSGDEAIYVEKIEGQRPYRMASRIGMHLRLHCTAIGKAILAHLPEEDVRRIVGRTGLERRTEHTITSLRDLWPELRRVRERGWALDDEENEEGIRCVAAPVFDHHGRVMGAVSVSTLGFEFAPEDGEATAPLVIDAARTISTELGAPDHGRPASPRS